MRFAASLVALLPFLMVLPQTTQARDLQGRLGVGYNAQFINSVLGERVPGVSVKYGLSRDLAVSAIVAAKTAGPTSTVSGVKLYKNLFLETNLNFYASLAGALVGVNGVSGAEFMGTLGAEFFIPGLESLGFGFEAGASLHNLSNNAMSFRTLGASFVDAGMHFYF